MNSKTRLMTIEPEWGKKHIYAREHQLYCYIILPHYISLL